MKKKKKLLCENCRKQVTEEKEHIIGTVRKEPIYSCEAK